MLDPHKGPFPPLASPWVYADGNDATCPVSHSCPHHSFSMMHYCPTRERFHFKFGATPRKYSASGSNLKAPLACFLMCGTFCGNQSVTWNYRFSTPFNSEWTSVPFLLHWVASSFVLCFSSICFSIHYMILTNILIFPQITKDLVGGVLCS